MISLKKEYRRLFEEARADLDRIIREEGAKGLEIREIVKKGEPTREILKTVWEEKVDLIILLAHEEGRLEHFLFGRSNEELVRRMPCSILFVKKEPQRVDWKNYSATPVLVPPLEEATV